MSNWLKPTMLFLLIGAATLFNVSPSQCFMSGGGKLLRSFKIHNKKVCWLSFIPLVILFYSATEAKAVYDKP